MNIQVKSVTTNPLLKRREISFVVDEKGTPDRVVVKEKLAALHNADFGLTFVRSIKGRFGKTELVGTAMIYDNEEAAKVEPQYIKIRNMAKDKRDEARKASRKPRSKKKSKE